MSRKHVNFIPLEFRPKLKIPYEVIPGLVLGLFALYSVGTGLNLYLETRSAENELTQLEVMGVETALKVQALTERSAVLEQNNEALVALKKVLNRKNYWSEIFKEMSILIPEGIWLTSFSNLKAGSKAEPVSQDSPLEMTAEMRAVLMPKQQNAHTKHPEVATEPKDEVKVAKEVKVTKVDSSEQLVVKGEASSQQMVAQFLSVLEQSHHFSGARIDFSEKEENIKPSRYKFEFIIPVKATTGGNG